MRSLLVGAILLLPPLASASAQAAPLSGLDQYVERAIAQWEVPGLAIAVVKDGRVVHSRGYGVLTLGKPERVNENTIFGIGSTTKAFTSAALAMLVDEGKVRWDDKVVDHLKDFRLYDSYASANITIRDLLSHTSGLAAGDRMWYNRRFDRAEVVRRVRYQEPVSSFRQEYHYSNTMFTAAGLVVDAASGRSWDDFIKERIFRPLGMTRSSTTVIGLESVDNVATLHTAGTGKPVVIPRWNQDNIGPAGSINSSVVDLAKWVRLQLARGTFDGRSLISPARFNDMHNAQTVIRGAGTSVEEPAQFSAYGLGWQLRDYHGRKLVSHGGGGAGVSAQVALVPQENLGVVVLTNLDYHSLPIALVYHVIDQYLGLPSRDWSARYLANRDSSAQRTARAEQQARAARARNTKPSLALDAYVGKYWHPYYDTVTVRREGDQLRLRFVDVLEGPLEHWQYDAFRADWTHPRFRSVFVNFEIGLTGDVRAIRIPADFEGATVEFTKLPNSPRR